MLGKLLGADILFQMEFYMTLFIITLGYISLFYYRDWTFTAPPFPIWVQVMW